MPNKESFKQNSDWDDAVQLFLQDCKVRNLSRESIRRYRKGLEKLQQHLDALELQLRDLSPAVFKKQVLPSLLDEGLASRTLNCNLHIYKSFAQLLCEEGWIDDEPFGADIKPLKLQPSSAHTFTDEHLYQLLALPDRTTFTGLRNYVMMLTLLDTGIRLRELAKLQVTDVLLDEGSLRVNHGKGRKSRLVPIERIAAGELKHYLLERGILNHNALWVNLDNQPFLPGGIRTMIARYCQSAEIKGIQCSCHTFRHTFAKKYLLNGGDVFTLKSIMGHAHIETTEMYVELFVNDLKAQHEKFSPIEHLAEALHLLPESEVNCI
ncbi:tyrosine-type recombinase/integrase [Paenibacillus xylanexedens]|uniref:tyrosine-type recombinase/integrase n=1 Tax=Paenibacillus xylanexedens TaxID=528191 RepID=UPI0021B2848E|nr:tyrosine-type recombinase/integrase [Paenibacillus xylanexedens]